MLPDWQQHTYKKMALDLVTDGELGDMGTREIIGYNYWINPYDPWFSLAERKLNVPFIMKEMEWYLDGNPAAKWIGDHAGVWKSVLDHDKWAVSNYGFEAFANGRLARVVKLLREEPMTRRAIVYFGSNAYVTDHMTKKDQPCASSIHFMVRNGRLKTVINQRSQDYIYGVSGDAIIFTLMVNLVAAALEVEADPILVQCGSFHHYPKHKEMVSKLLNPTIYTIEWPVPEMLTQDMAIQTLTWGRKKPNELIDWIHDLAWNEDKENFWP